MAVLKVYNGATWDVAIGKVYDGSVWKEKMNFYDGSAQVELYSTACTAGTSAMPTVNDNQTEPQATETGAKWVSTGNVEWYEDDNQVWQDTGDDWIGSCANTEYDYRWILVSGSSGDVTANIAVDTWQQASLGDLLLEQSEQDEGTYTVTVEFQLRRRSDNVTILTDQFIMSVVVDPP